VARRCTYKLKKISYIISITKSQFYIPKIIVIKYLCNSDGQQLKALKIVKIILWKEYKDI